MPLTPPQAYRKTFYTHRRDTRANQPLAADVLPGTLYFVTDEGITERSSGIAWQSYSSAAVPTFTAGSVIFAGASGELAEDNTNFFFDNTNNILRVPIIAGGTGTGSDLILRSTTGVGDSGARVFIQTGNNGAIGAVEVSGDDRGRVGIGTVGFVTLDRPFIVCGPGADIGYIALFRNVLSGSSYVQVATFGGVNDQAGFAFGQVANNTEWRMAIVGNEADSMRWQRNISGSALSVLFMSTTGNLIINDTLVDPGTGSKCLIFGDGTAPSSLDANTAGLYANDVSGTVEMFAINEAGEVTRLTWPAPQTYIVTNVTTDRSYDADATDVDELADVLGTLIDDLRNRGIVA